MVKLKVKGASYLRSNRDGCFDGCFELAYKAAQKEIPLSLATRAQLLLRIKVIMLCAYLDCYTGSNVTELIMLSKAGM
jgi:hypothetical protein